MFFGGNRIDAFREMICSDTLEEREAALAKILPMQQGDFEALYEAQMCIRDRGKAPRDRNDGIWIELFRPPYLLPRLLRSHPGNGAGVNNADV